MGKTVIVPQGVTYATEATFDVENVSGTTLTITKVVELRHQTVNISFDATPSTAKSASIEIAASPVRCGIPLFTN